MAGWLKHQLNGYVMVRMQGQTPERFFNLCAANQIEVWRAGYQKDSYFFYMTVEGFFSCKPLVKKSKVRLCITKKFGLPFFLHRNRKRKLFFAGFLSFFLILYGMSLFIWDIQIEGNIKYTDHYLLDFLESQQVTYGMAKKQISCEQLESQLRTSFDEITWVSVRVNGTRLEIQIKENEVLLELPDKQETPCHLIAKQDGIIKQMVVRTGKPLVKPGDQVVKGQVLVEGIIPITNDGEEIVNSHYVHADADILAETNYEIKKTISLYHQVDSDTGRTRKGLYLKVFPYSFVYMLPKKEGTTWKVETDIRQIKLFENFYLPIYYGSVEAREFISYQRNYTEQELSLLSDQFLADLIENLMEKGVQIIENNDRISISGSECHFVFRLKALEEIGQQAAIIETEETDNPDERN